VPRRVHDHDVVVELGELLADHVREGLNASWSLSWLSLHRVPGLDHEQEVDLALAADRLAAEVGLPLALTAPLPLSSPPLLPELLVLAPLPELPELPAVDVIGCGPLVKPDDATSPPQPGISSRAALSTAI
jgi:hypothetical protein